MHSQRKKNLLSYAIEEGNLDTVTAVSTATIQNAEIDFQMLLFH